MRSLRQQIIVSLLASLVLLAASFIGVFGHYMQERAISAAIVKAQSDLATCTRIIDLQYPGDWKVENGSLFKGKEAISQNNELVDSLSALTGDTVTVFMNDTRIATTVRGTDGVRAIGTKVSDAVAQKVLKNGEVFLGEANVVGELYQTAYEPLRDGHGNIVGMFYVGISRSYTQELIVNSLWRMAALGGGITLIVGILAWLFVEKIIIRPLRSITLGTRDLATGHVTEKVDISGPKEIGELASAFNQVIEKLENVTKELEHRSDVSEKGQEFVIGEQEGELEDRLGINTPEIDDSAATHSEQDSEQGISPKTWENERYLNERRLPKGLNKETLMQITDFCVDQHDFVSAEEVAEGVKLTRVTVRRYLEFLEERGVLMSKLRYGTVGRPVRIWSNVAHPGDQEDSEKRN